jgi:hypothetical protein
MDKLSITLLTILFLNDGSYLIWIGLLFALLTQTLPLNYKTLFNFTSLTTYCFYGFTGIIYTFLCTLSLLICGAMYWFELSMDDVKNKMKELNDDAIDGNDCDDNESTNQIEQYIDKFTQYKTKYVNMFCEKTRLNLISPWMGTIGTFYTHVSVMFDKFCQMLYGLMCRFRTLTQDMKGLKSIYNVYDTMCQYKTTVDKLKHLNSESQNKSEMQEIDPSQIHTNKLMDLCNFPDLSLDHNSLNQEMADAQAKFDKMTPDERKKEAEVMMNVMKNMFDSFDNMKSMMEEMSPPK